MSAEDRYARFVAEKAKPPPLTSGDTLHWDGRRGASQSVEHMPVSEPIVCAVWLAPLPLPGHRASPDVALQPGCLRPASPAPAIDWAKEAARLTLYLNPALLLAPLHNKLPGATGTLTWVSGQRDGECLTPTVHPALLVYTAYASLQVACVELVLHLPINDPLQSHIALVLQAAVDAESEAGQMYAEVLAGALAVHFLRRYTTSQPAECAVSGGFVPYKLQRTLTYIHAHLDQALSLTTLAAVAQMSLTHFAHLFKHTTGLAPHQYVNQCRMEWAKRLLDETDLPLIEIGPQVGYADQSHFTAIFRRHVAMTPKTYRNTTRRAFW